jgi:hypothetical protein
VARRLETRYADAFPDRDAETYLVEPSAGVSVDGPD